MKQFISNIRERISDKQCDEKGSTIPFYVIFFITMIGLLGVGVDFGTAMLVHETRNNDLAIVKNKVESDAYAMQIKNTTDPGVFISKLVNKSLRESGFEGEIDVYIYECTKQDIFQKCHAADAKDKSDSRRVIGWLAVTRENVYTPFMTGFGMNPITVQSVIAGTAMPYSGGVTWRPPNQHGGEYANDEEPLYNGVYEFAENALHSASPIPEVGPYRNKPYTDSVWPVTLKRVIENRLEKISVEKSDNYSEIDPIWTEK